MEWGIHLPHIGRQASREAVLRMARSADELGMHSGWVSDHIAWPAHIESNYPYTDDGHFPAGNDMPWLDPVGTLFFVGAVTERLKLGATVLILGYRPPMLTAKAFASLDVMTDGRALLGVGVGWMREEFEALGMPWDHRGARADEQLELFHGHVQPRHALLPGPLLPGAGGGLQPPPGARGGCRSGWAATPSRRSGAPSASATPSMRRSRSAPRSTTPGGGSASCATRPGATAPS